ncbi:MAG: response regulator [Rhodospirillaceae bacterium]|nr:response regulator [Rhodospirillales bacterium]
MSQRTVLIVDDNVVNLELYAELLGLTDYRAEMVDEAKAVLPAAIKCKPGLVLLDLTLPNSSGFEVARGLKAAPETRDIPIIALTAMQRDGLVAELQKSGFIGLVSKPCGVDTFLDAVTWAMEGCNLPFRTFA